MNRLLELYHVPPIDSQLLEQGTVAVAQANVWNVGLGDVLVSLLCTTTKFGCLDSPCRCRYPKAQASNISCLTSVS
jgi:hypothetical protein